jgi:trk system potassium uptake protein TrkA
MLRLPPAAKLINFSVKNFEIIEFKIKDDSILNGLKVSEIRNKFKSKFLVCAVQRGNEAYIPDGNFILNAGDKIGVTASANEINKMFKELNMKKTSAKKVMIYGGSKTAVFLAKQLSDADIDVIIIEKNKEKCQKLIDDLPKCTIICGDCSSHELLIEEGLTETDAVIALTNMDELNVLMSSYATSQGTTTVITKINKQELIPISEHWGLDAIVSPQKSVANTIVRYARALKNSRGSNIETLYKLMDNKVEAIEFTAKKDSEILNIPLKDLQLKQNILIAGIVRNRKTIIPTGSDMMLSGDKIIVLCAGHCINDLSDIVR